LGASPPRCSRGAPVRGVVAAWAPWGGARRGVSRSMRMLGAATLLSSRVRVPPAGIGGRWGARGQEGGREMSRV
jgi:hypothetical protein